jgi:hypothetical protein
MPQGDITEETSSFYRDLAIPSLRGRPNLLLHRLGLDPNSRVDMLSRSQSHW